MKSWKKQDLESMDRRERLRLINSISGIHPAFLIATQSSEGIPNVTIFNTVIHLGSSPAMLGFIVRPEGETPRHTLENLRVNPNYTINMVAEDMIEQAHATSGKYPAGTSEFDSCRIAREEIEEFPVPFVRDSPVKMGMLLHSIVPIEANETSLVVGTIQSIHMPEDFRDETGDIDLERIKAAGVCGLNTYYSLIRNQKQAFVRSNS